MSRPAPLLQSDGGCGLYSRALLKRLTDRDGTPAGESTPGRVAGESLSGMSPGSYSGKLVALATQHRKEVAIKRPFSAALGVKIVVPTTINTDSFGTFSGEIKRPGSALNVLLYKARQGMTATGLSLGLANEGSFGPHPDFPFTAVDDELMVFVDDVIGLNIYERLITTETNFAHSRVEKASDLTKFLERIGFPRHGVIVRPNDRAEAGVIFKGIRDFAELGELVTRCAGMSGDGLALVETDMRAHFNPTRMRAIRKLAFRLVRRIMTACPSCDLPGFGLVRTERGLPCRICATPTPLEQAKILGCQNCPYEVREIDESAVGGASPAFCPECNP